MLHEAVHEVILLLETPKDEVCFQVLLSSKMLTFHLFVLTEDEWDWLQLP